MKCGKLMWKWVWAWLHWESDLSDLRMGLEWNALNMFKHWLFCIAVEGRPVCARGKFVCSLNIERRSTGGWLFHTMVYVHPTGGCCLWLWWWCWWWWRRWWWWYTWYSTVVSGAGWLEQQSACLFPWGHFYSWGAAQEGAQGYPGGWWNLNGSIQCLNISQPSIRYCDVLRIVCILLQLLKLITFGGEADIPIGGSLSVQFHRGLHSKYCCTVISSLFHGKWISNLCSQYISTNIYRYCILFFLSNFLIQYILPLSVSWHIDYLPWASMGHYTVYTMAILIGPESAWIIPLHKWLINLLVSPGFQVGCPIYKWVNQLHMHDIAIYRWYSHLWMI